MFYRGLKTTSIYSLVSPTNIDYVSIDNSTGKPAVIIDTSMPDPLWISQRITIVFLAQMIPSELAVSAKLSLWPQIE